MLTLELERDEKDMCNNYHDNHDITIAMMSKSLMIRLSLEKISRLLPNPCMNWSHGEVRTYVHVHSTVVQSAVP